MSSEKEASYSLIKIGEVSSIDSAKHTARVSFPQDDSLLSYDLPVICRNTYENADYNMPDVGEDVVCVFCPGGEEDGFILGSIYAGEITPPTTDPDERKVKFSDDTTVTYNRKTHSLDIIIADTSIHADRENVDVKVSEATIHLDGNTLSIYTPQAVTIKTTVASVEADTVDVQATTITAKATTISAEATTISAKATTVTIDAPTTTVTGHMNVQNGISVTGGTGTGTATITGSIKQTSGNFETSGNVTASGDVEASGISLTGHTHTGVHGETSGPH